MVVYGLGIGIQIHPYPTEEKLNQILKTQLKI